MRTRWRRGAIQDLERYFWRDERGRERRSKGKPAAGPRRDVGRWFSFQPSPVCKKRLSWGLQCGGYLPCCPSHGPPALATPPGSLHTHVPHSLRDWALVLFSVFNQKTFWVRPEIDFGSGFHRAAVAAAFSRANGSDSLPVQLHWSRWKLICSINSPGTAWKPNETRQGHSQPDKSIRTLALTSLPL